MKLTEFIFVDNCLNATFEEITVNIDEEAKALMTELQSKQNLQLETLSTFLDESFVLVSEQMKEKVQPLFRLRCQLLDTIRLPNMIFSLTQSRVSQYVQGELNSLKYQLLLQRNESLVMSAQESAALEQQTRQSFDFFCQSRGQIFQRKFL